MDLSHAQLLTLQAWILANGPWPTDQHIVDALNVQASPTYIVWRTLVAMNEIMQNGFNWTRVDNLSVGKARIWDWMTQYGPKINGVEAAINPSLVNIRAGIDAVWVGTQADLDVRAAVYVHCKRSSTLAEQLLATGTGSDASPATMGLGAEGLVSVQDVVDAQQEPA